MRKDMAPCGAFLAVLRKERGWTQSELAAQLHVTDKAVSRWETGKGYPDIKSLQAISALFDVSINELLAGARIPPEAHRARADQMLLTTLRRNQMRMLSAAVLVLVLAVIALLISLKLFYNGAIAADELNASPAVFCGGAFWLLMDWLRMGLLALLTGLSLYLIGAGSRL